jgi:uncharacterized protein
MARYIFPIILLIPQMYLLFRFLRWQRTMRKLPRFAFILVLGLFALFDTALIGTMFMGPLRMEYPDWFISFVVYPFLVWHASTFIIAIVMLVGAAIRLPFKALWHVLRHLGPTKEKAAALAARPRIVQFDEARRTFLRRGLYGLTAASFGGTAYGMILGKGECDVTEREFRIHGLPHALDGFSIALVTDIHSSIYMQKHDMIEYVRRINDMGADVIVVGGDLVNSTVEEIYPFAEAFEKLKAPLGAYGVLGNHDFYTREEDTITRIANEAGIRILRDEAVHLRKNGSTLCLLGVDDVGNSRDAEDHIRRAMRTVRPNIPTVLAAHRPYYVRQAAGQGVDLVLSGHTHGGQLVFGRIGNRTFTPATLVSPYVWGYYRVDSTQMYVSRGIGTVAVPVRINCPPELTRIVLRPA